LKTEGSFKSNEKHRLWKGGISREFSQKKFNSLKTKCSICENTKNLCIHHIDRNPKNNVLENITILCRSCHQKEHKIGYWPKPREKTKQVCVICKSVFESPNCKKQKYCSKQCYYNYRIIQGLIERRMSNCVICGKTFRQDHSNRKTCSRKCGYAYRGNKI